MAGVSPEIKTRFTLGGLREAATGLRGFVRSMSGILSSARSSNPFGSMEKSLSGVEKQGKGVASSLKKSKTEADSLTKSVMKLGARGTWGGIKLGAGGAALAIGGVTTKMTSLSAAALKAAKDSATALKSISIDAQRIGGSTSDVAVLGYAADLTGTDRDELVTQIATISNEFLTLRENITKTARQYSDFYRMTAKEAAIYARLGQRDQLNGLISGFSSADLEARKASIGDIENRLSIIDAALNSVEASKNAHYSGLDLTDAYNNPNTISSSRATYGKQPMVDRKAARFALEKERMELQQAYDEFWSGQSTQAQALHELEQYGIDIERASRGGVEGLLEISDAFQHIQDPSQRARVAMRLFGEDAGVKLIPILNGGRKAIDEYRRTLEKSGAIATKEDIAVAEEYTRAIQNLKTATSGVQMTIGRALTPDLTKGSQELTAWLIKSREEIAKAAVEAFNDTRVFSEDVVGLFGGNTDDVKTPWLDTVVQKTIGLRAVWADVRKQITLLWEGKDSDYGWINAIRDGLISIKKFAVDAWKVISGGNAVDFAWMNKARDYVVAFANRVQDAFGMLQSLVQGIGELFKPLLDYFGTDIMTVGVLLGMTRMVGLFSVLTAGAGLLMKALGGVFSLAGAAAGAVGAVGGGAAGAAGTAAATAGGLRVALAGVGAAIGGVTSAALLLGTTLAGAFMLGQAAAAKMTEGTRAAYEEVWKQQAALIRAQDQGRINELLKSRDPATDGFRKSYWADKGVNIVTAADRAAAGRKQMDDFIGWRREDGIEAAGSRQPAAVFRYDINVNGRQAQVTGDMNVKRALDELNNGFS